MIFVFPFDLFRARLLRTCGGCPSGPGRPALLGAINTTRFRRGQVPATGRNRHSSGRRRRAFLLRGALPGRSRNEKGVGGRRRATSRRATSRNWGLVGSLGAGPNRPTPTTTQPPRRSLAMGPRRDSERAPHLRIDKYPPTNTTSTTTSTISPNRVFRIMRPINADPKPGSRGPAMLILGACHRRQATISSRRSIGQKPVRWVLSTSERNAIYSPRLDHST